MKQTQSAKDLAYLLIIDESREALPVTYQNEYLHYRIHAARTDTSISPQMLQAPENLVTYIAFTFCAQKLV